MGKGKNNVKEAHPSNNKGKDKHKRSWEETLSRGLSWALRHQGPKIGFSMTSDGYVPVSQVLSCRHAKLTPPRHHSTKWTLEEIQHVVQSNAKQRFQLDWCPSSDYPLECSQQSQQQQQLVKLIEEEARTETTNTASSENDVGDKKLILCIRATQGHSLKNVIDPLRLLTPLLPKDLLACPRIVHGTYPKPWESIAKQGLKCMNRTHIHFATGVPTTSRNSATEPQSSSSSSLSSSAIKKNNFNTSNNNVISGMRSSAPIHIDLQITQCANAYPALKFFRSANGVILTAGLHDKGTLPIEFFSHVINVTTGTILLDRRQATT